MILITGATGLVGSHILYELTSRGCKTKALKRKNSNIESVRRTFECYTDRADEYLSMIEWTEGDMNDIGSLERAAEGVNTIYHCAGVVSFNIVDKQKIYNTNIQGTEHIVEICIRKRIKLCYVSSVAATGDVDNPYEYIDEHTPRDFRKKRSEYSKSKYLSEAVVYHGIQRGLDAVIVNPSIILGAGHWNTGSSQLFRTVAKKVPFYTKGITGFVDVRDVASVMRQLAENDIQGERFILNQGNYSYKELFQAIAEKLNIRKPFIYARPFMTNLVSKAAPLIKLLTGKQSGITKETSASAHSVSFYNGTKVKMFLPDFEYREMNTTIEDIARSYKKQVLEHH